MKVINKILCFLSVLVLCVPLLCFNVSAEDSTSYDYSYLYGTDFSGKYSSFFISQLKEVSNGPFLNGSSETGKPNLRKSDYWKEDTNGLKTNYIGWVEPNTSDYYVMDNNINNVLLLAFAQSQWGYWKDNSKPIYYYCYSYVYKESDIQIHKNYEFYFSNSPLTFSSCTNSYFDYVKLNSIDSSHVTVYTFLDELDGVSYPNAYASSGLAINNSGVCGSQVTTGNEICFKSGDYGQVMIEEQYVNPSRESQFKCNLDSFRFDSSFSNHDIDSSCFTSGTVDNVSDIASDKTLSDQIDVKLTPEFGLDMDRVFDQNTGQNDYFKFEVTNNSDSNIQFCASIVPKGTETTFSKDEINNWDGVSSFIYEKSLWNYVYNCTYYRLTYDAHTEYLFMGRELDYYVEKCIGNCFWVYLSPGQSFTDYIYWENVKIFPYTEYDFVVSAFKLSDTLDYATACFLSDEQLKADYDKETSWYNFWTNLNLDESAYDYIIDFENIKSVFFDSIYRVTFSVDSIPQYSSTIRGGNSKISGGWSDTNNQLNNPYYTENTKTGEVKAVSNWSEYNGSLSDVDVNIDDVGISDVKGYISYSQSFFSLLKSVFQSFPSLWILIVFGLTAIIVIAIVRYIRG